MSSRAPSTQPRNADFLVAIMCFTFPFFFLYFLKIFFFSLSLSYFILFSLIYPPQRLRSPSFSLSPPYTHRRRQSCTDVCISVTKRSETPSTTRDVHVKWRNLMERRPFALFVARYEERRFIDSYRSFLSLLWRNCGRIFSLSRYSRLEISMPCGEKIEQNL